MRVLLTNDDGIFAPGLMALRSALARIAHVDVVAPESEQSCGGHAISLHKPVLCHRIERDGDFFGFALEGTPADCVKIALAELLDQPPDLIVSGINPAQNTGTYVLYSGTVAAAIEGTMAGIPSVAVSVAHHPDGNSPDFARAGQLLLPLLRTISALPEASSTTFNVNLPLDLDDVRGVKVVRQSAVVPRESYVRRSDPRGRTYFWIAGETAIEKVSTFDCDWHALAQGYITVTPLRFDLTHEHALKQLEQISWHDALSPTHGEDGQLTLEDQR